METFNLLQLTIESSSIIILISVIRKLFKNHLSPNVRYFLWIFVALRILIPFKADIPVFLPQADNQIEINNVVNKLPDDSSENFISPENAALQTMNNATNHFIQNEEIKTIAKLQTYNIFTIKNVVFSAWIAGIICLTMLIFANNYKLFVFLKINRKKIKELPNGLMLYSVPGFNCLAGVFSPVIYVDADVLTEEGLIENVIKHELEHYKVKDHIWQVVRTICLILQWYNPLVWWAYHISKRDCEIACDYRTTKDMTKEERYSYSSSLLFAIKCSNSKKQNMYLATSMASDKEFIKERIQTAMSTQRKNTIFLSILVICIIGIISVVSLNFHKLTPLVNLKYQSFSGTIGDASYGMIVYRENDLLNMFCFNKSDMDERCMLSGSYDADDNTFELVTEDVTKTFEGKYYTDNNDIAYLKGNLIAEDGTKENVSATYIRSYADSASLNEQLENFDYIDPYETLAFIENFVEAIQNGATNTLAGMMQYPLTVYEDGNGKQIEDAHAFVTDYASIITEETIKDTLEGLQKDLIINWQGVHFGNIWFYPDTGIWSINNNSDDYYESDAYWEKVEEDDPRGIEKDTDYGLEDTKDLAEIVDAFSKAYFESDVDTMNQYLAETFSGNVETYPSDWGDYQIITTKGLSDIGEKNVGDSHVVNVEFKPEGMDGYVYLYIELLKDENGWKVLFYGLEL